MKKNLIILFVILSFNSGFGQKTIENEFITAELPDKVFGKNKRHYVSTYLDFGFAVSPSEDITADVHYGNSSSFAFGLRYKRKFTKIWSVGFDFGGNFANFRLKQDMAKMVPNNVIFHRENLLINDLVLGFYNRINFDPKRGNKQGIYLDLGILGSWMSGNRHVVEPIIHATNKIDPLYFTKNQQIINRNPIYFNDFTYSLTARVGFEWIYIFGKYRMTDFFKPAFNFSELPRLEIGIGFNS